MKEYIRKLEAGSIIFEEGSPGTEFFIILSGNVRIEKHMNGERRTLATLGPGEFFGEMAVLDKCPRSATAVAVGASTTLMPVDTARFIYLVSQQPGFAMLVMEILSKRQRNGETSSVNSIPSTTTNKKALSEPVRIDEHCYQLRSRSRSCNAYLFKGVSKTVLIDTALPSGAQPLAAALNQIGINPSDIDLIILTHEHFDHTASVPFFGGRPTVAAYRLAANKIRLGDEFATMQRAFGENSTPFNIDIELSEGATIDTGHHRLRVVHTPGHSSGGISLIDQNSGLLIAGDTLLKGGPIGGIFGSGNISDLISSLKILKSLRPRILLPGHGPISNEPEVDIEQTLDRCSSLLTDSKMIFDALEENSSVNLIIEAYKDLNRGFLR